MAIAIQCDLRLPDVAPAVPGINYQARNALAYKFNNYYSATSVVPPCTHVLNNFSEIEQSAGGVAAI